MRRANVKTGAGERRVQLGVRGAIAAPGALEDLGWRSVATVSA